MNEAQIRDLCARVSSQMDEIDETSDLSSLIDSLEDPDLVLSGAALARGFLNGSVTITEKTIPLIASSEAALAEFLESQDDEEDEDE